MNLKNLIFPAIIAAVALIDGFNAESMMAMAIVAGVAGGKHVADEPLTTAITNAESPDFLVNEIDRRLVKIRPMATPIDQLSRWAGAKKAGSMIVDYYSVDTRPTSVTVTADSTGCTSPETASSRYSTATLSIDNPDVIEASETLLAKGVQGYRPDGKTPSSQDLVLYVESKNQDKILVHTVNGMIGEDGVICVPSIPADTKLIRMGRAASELDVQTAQFESLPQKSQNFCQIFKMQIEQSTLQKIANKEVGWTFSDQEEAAIYDMRLGMEKNFLFGVKGRVNDRVKKEEILLTGGIWDQAGNEFSYKKEEFNTDTLVKLMRTAFTGNAGNKRKVLIGGSGLIERLNCLEYTKTVMAGENIVKWGIDFSEIRSKFGKLYVLLSEVFDECGMEDDGIIIDPEYLQKYSHIPFTTEQLSLKEAGVRNTDAIVLTEASCVNLRYPKAHTRIVCEKA